MLCMVLGVGFDEVALLALCLTDVGSAKAAGGGRPWVVKVNWVNSPVRKVHWGSTPAEYRKTMKNQNGKEWILWIQFMRCKQNATNFIYFIQTHCYLFTKCILYLYCKSRQSYISYLYLRECLFKCGSTQGHTHVESVLWEKWCENDWKMSQGSKSETLDFLQGLRPTCFTRSFRSSTASSSPAANST